MAMQFSVAVRNNRLDSIETSIGATAKLQIRSGAPPANCAAADSGTLLAEITCPADYMSAASGGVKSLLGTWQDLSADASGTAGHFRMKDNGATATHIQGTVGTSGTDMIVDSVTFTAGQTFSVTAFAITDGNA